MWYIYIWHIIFNIIYDHNYVILIQNYIIHTIYIIILCTENAYTLQFLYQFIHQWSFTLVSYLLYCEWCCNQNESASIFTRCKLCFLCVYIQRRHKSGQQMYEKELTITNHQENQNKNHYEISPYTH